tara:strand:- start:267 stop:443 length:177 start_codon:yes stop_codon:yes gene_type:complete
MYIVVSHDMKKYTLELQNWKVGDRDDRIFGPFEHKYDAEEWVDNNSGKKYWTIIKIGL